MSFKPVSIGGYVVDVALTEEHTFESEVTEYPIESGSTITDNIRNKPIELSLECVVTDTPIGNMEVVRSLDGDDVAPSITAYAKLKEMRKKGEPVRVTTSLDVFPSMLITNLTIPRTVEDGGLRFTITLKEAIILTNLRTLVKVAIPTGARPFDLGAQFVKLFGPANAAKLKAAAEQLNQAQAWQAAKEQGKAPAPIKDPNIIGGERPVTRQQMENNPWWFDVPDKTDPSYDPDIPQNPGNYVPTTAEPTSTSTHPL